MATTKLTGTLIRSGSIPVTALGGGVVSSSTQVIAGLPTGIVSSSAQYPGWVTASSQIDYNSIQNKLSGVISSSAQVQPLLPANTVSSSAQVTAFLPASTISSSTQFKTLTDPFTGSFTGSHTGTFPYSGLTNIPSGIVSSSAQVSPLLPGGTVSSSAQYPGWVTASSQIDYNSITNKLSGVVSSAAQVQPLLPGGTVSSSAQYPGWVTSSAQVLLNTLTGTTFSNNSFYFPIDLRVEGNLTAQQIYTEYVSSSVIYESGSSKFGDTTDDVMSVTGSILVLGGRISGSMTGMFSASSQVDYNSITNKLSGVVSSAAQVQPLLPGGTVSSSAQYPGWVTSSTQIVWSSVPYNAGIVSSSAQVQPLLPGGTVSSSAQYPGWVTSSAQVVWSSVNYNAGIMSSSAQTVSNLTGQSPTFSGSQFSSIVSGSGLAYRLVVPVGTNYYAT